MCGPSETATQTKKSAVIVKEGDCDFVLPYGGGGEDRLLLKDGRVLG